MAIKLLQSAEFDYPVVIDYFDAKGKSRENTTIFTFRRLDTDELTERQQAEGQLFTDCIIDCDGDEDAALRKFKLEFIRSGKSNISTAEMADDLLDIVVGWTDVDDGDGGKAEFSRENLILLLKTYPKAYSAIKAAFTEAHSAEGRRKNSSQQPKPGPTRKQTFEA